MNINERTRLEDPKKVPDGNLFENYQEASCSTTEYEYVELKSSSVMTIFGRAWDPGCRQALAELRFPGCCPPVQQMNDHQRLLRFNRN